MILDRRHWLTATATALLLHGSLAAMYLRPAEPGAEQAGAGGIKVAFGMAGGAPGAVAVTAAEVAPVDAVAAPDVAFPSAEAVETVAEVAAADAVAEKVSPPAATARTLPSAAERESPSAVEAAAPPPREAPVETIPRDRKTASIAGSAGRSGIESSAHAGSGKSASRGGNPGARAGYLARLMAWLERHKEYPRLARKRREQGTAMLMFTVGRDGTVSGVSISQSSGSASLDREVRDMIVRATPLPEFSDDMTEAQLTLAVPVRFSLR